jgi:hypothetical protein
MASEPLIAANAIWARTACEVSAMVEKTFHPRSDTRQQQQPPSRDKQPLNEFEQFISKCAVTKEDKSALPAYLRRLLGWER